MWLDWLSFVVLPSAYSCLRGARNPLLCICPMGVEFMLAADAVAAERVTAYSYPQRGTA